MVTTHISAQQSQGGPLDFFQNLSAISLRGDPSTFYHLATLFFTFFTRTLHRICFIIISLRLTLLDTLFTPCQFIGLFKPVKFTYYYLSTQSTPVYGLHFYNINYHMDQPWTNYDLHYQTHFLYLVRSLDFLNRLTSLIILCNINPHQFMAYISTILQSPKKIYYCYLNNIYLYTTVGQVSWIYTIT